MENNIKKALDNFIEDEQELEFQRKVQEDKKKYIKTDNTIIERIDRIIIDESGRQLLREQY